MKLIFSPYYDSRVFVGMHAGCSLGTKHVGPLGLLAELELRAGLTTKENDSTKRMLNYCQALKEYASKEEREEELFYWKAFEVDMLNVARRILEWRDALVYAGLGELPEVPTELSEGGRDIVHTLKEVDKCCFADRSSVADRWKRLMNASNYLTQDWTIQVEMTEELVEPTIRECIRKSGARVTFVAELPKLEHKVRMIKFANLTDGYQWAMSQEGADKMVMVNRDNVALNAVMDSLGKPHVEAEASEVFTPIMQLFTAGMRLFSKAVDYYALLAYLSVPYNPLGDYVTAEGESLKSALLKQLRSTGGFGMDEKTKKSWSSLIEGATLKDGRKHHLPMAYCIEQWKLGYSLKAIEEYCNMQAEWIAHKVVSVPDAIVREQLLAVKGCFDLLPKIAHLTGKTELTYQELQVCTDGAASLCSYHTHTAQVGAVELVEDIKAIGADCTNAVWMDNYDRGMLGYAYSFITHKDIALLNEAGMTIPSYDNLLKAETVATHLAMAHIKEELVVLTPEKVEGRRQYPIPLPHEIEVIEDMTTWTPDGEPVVPQDAYSQQLEYRVDADIFKKLEKTRADGGMRRDRESYSSLEMLIQRPFDYVLDYLLNCKSTDDNTMLSTVKGNVAHRLINNAVVEAKEEWSLIKKALTADFDANFDRAVQEVGVALMAPENVLALAQFKEVMKHDSTQAFIQIVENNDLSVVRSEMDITVELPTIGAFNAKIDMVLKTRAGGYLIMDFKWTDSSGKKRVDEITNNEEMQLALYTEAIKQSPDMRGGVEGVGYFLLRQGEFITEYQGLKKSEHIRVIEKKKTDSIWEMIEASYRCRMAQLMGEGGQSVIEEGELMKVSAEKVEYMASEGVFPLRLSSGMKETSYGKNVILKGMMR